MILAEKMSLKTCKVFENSEVAPSVYYLKTERTSDFIPGQMIRLTENIKTPPRLYSIASGIHDDYFGIIYSVVKGGKLTPLLSGLKPGDKVFCSSAFGSFTDPAKETIWIATGTGIAPFLSMVLSGLHSGKTLIRGARQESDFYFDEIFKLKLKDKYIRCCSSGELQNSYHGRVTQYLWDHEADKKSKYMLCGSAEMVVDSRDILINKGVSFTQIISEIYF
ncbi:MAG: FAD-binding oxidoreductase [Bacteroidales bacterium]|jgi:ferredoxin--NADP+ reductase|nr:FAD-binding oxidoreductase [Bacteroidales bacterium]